MYIRNNYNSPTPRARPKAVPASSLINGVSGQGSVTLSSNANMVSPSLLNPSLSSPTLMDAPRTIHTTGTFTIDVLATDNIGGIMIYQSSTPVTTVQLPTTTGLYPICDGSLNSETYNLTVLPPTGLKILGQNSYTINTNGAALTFYNDGTGVVVS